MAGTPTDTFSFHFRALHTIRGQRLEARQRPEAIHDEASAQKQELHQDSFKTTIFQ